MRDGCCYPRAPGDETGAATLTNDPTGWVPEVTLVDETGAATLTNDPTGWVPEVPVVG
jgi:hypothetical protein